jgi:arabinose-5-phosphate isomerase
VPVQHGTICKVNPVPSPDNTHTLAAQRVLLAEADALRSLAQHLPADFAAAINLILHVKGRVIVAGMGKSGHVARKIAGTLASTGTPSFFVHPAEASHGDLGMVMPGDICILLSNSGETAELRDLTAHCLRFDVPIIGISSGAHSSLMQAATLRLTLPNLPEACAIGMAPTTSTTMMMALGDALAVALMEARKFEVETFRNFHPGGKLGAQLTPLSKIMYGADKLPLIGQDATMSDAILKMTEGGFGIVGIIDAQGDLRGVISDGDLRRNLDGLMARAPRDVANPAPVTATPDMLAAEALARMNSAKIGALFVCEDRRPIGILHLHDLLRIGVV